MERVRENCIFFFIPAITIGTTTYMFSNIERKMSEVIITSIIYFTAVGQQVLKLVFRGLRLLVWDDY